MPSPGHPGHFPKPPGWVDHPPAADPGQGGAASAAPGPPSRAAEANAKVAEMLGADEELAEAVEQAEDAIAEDIEDLSAVVAARDEYLDSLRRLQADFENYKKRVQRQQVELQERAAEKLVEKLLPALDTFDLAMAHAEGDTGFEPVYRSLVGVLSEAGLERLDPAGQPFDPNEHDAVLHEEGGDSPTPEVIEVLRAGYRWKGRVLRAAMVKVKG